MAVSSTLAEQPGILLPFRQNENDPQSPILPSMWDQRAGDPNQILPEAAVKVEPNSARRLTADEEMSKIMALFQQFMQISVPLAGGQVQVPYL